MAKAPNVSTRKAAKAKTAPETVEDAEVIEESGSENEAAAGMESEKEPTMPPASATQEVVTAAAETDDGKSHVGTNPPTTKKRSATGFLALLLGGALAAVIGFGAARYVVPEGWPFPGVAPEVDPLVAVIEAQSDQMKTLADRLAALEADTAVQDALDDLQAESQRFGNDVTARIDGLDGRLDALAERVDAVERLAPEGSEAAQTAAAAYERELAALRAMFEDELALLEAQQDDVMELEAAAAEAAKAAVGRAALARIATALDTGQPFADVLAELTEATGIAAPEALARASETGVPTLASLQESFPPAARAALDVAITAAVEDGSMSRTSAFLRSQLGTRSLEPREGDDPDAILSRAEAALKRGDIGAALDELDAMPAASAPALSAWREMAGERKAALDAGAALAQELNTK